MIVKRLHAIKILLLVTGLLLGSTSLWAQNGLQSSGLRDNKVALKVSPNPVVNTLNVELLDNVQTGNVTLVNVIGSVVASAQVKNGAATVDMKAMPPGLYYVKFSDGTNTGFIKVVKQ